MIYVCLHREPGPVKGCLACDKPPRPGQVVLPGELADAYVALYREAEKHTALDAFTKAVRDAGVTA